MNSGNRMPLALSLLLSLAACSATASSHGSSMMADNKMIDLTHTFDERTIYWPTSKPFTWEKEAWGRSEGFWYTAGRYSASEHGGTHLDAPIHFGEGGRAMDEIPLSKLIGDAVVIDISTKAAADADDMLTTKDIEDWEARHGRIPDDSIVLIRTGWGKFWGDRKKYLGSDKPLDAADLHFPGISLEAAEMLVKQRRIDAVGIDTASLDRGASTDFMAHRVLNGADVYGLENVANLDRLPPKGAKVIALPMKIGGGTGGPVRIIALLP